MVAKKKTEDLFKGTGSQFYTLLSVCWVWKTLGHAIIFSSLHKQPSFDSASPFLASFFPGISCQAT